MKEAGALMNVRLHADPRFGAELTVCSSPPPESEASGGEGMGVGG